MWASAWVLSPGVKWHVAQLEVAHHGHVVWGGIKHCRGRSLTFWGLLLYCSTAVDADHTVASFGLVQDLLKMPFLLYSSCVVKVNHPVSCHLHVFSYPAPSAWNSVEILPIFQSPEFNSSVMLSQIRDTSHLVSIALCQLLLQRFTCFNSVNDHHVRPALLLLPYNKRSKITCPSAHTG